MADPLRILVVIDNFHPLVGGAEGAALASAQALAARGHRLDVLTMRKHPDSPGEEGLGDLWISRFDERVPPRPFGRFFYERMNASAAARHFRRRLNPASYDALLLHPIDAAFGVARSDAAPQAARIYCFHAPLGEEARVQARGLREMSRSPLRRLAIRFTAGLAARYRERQQKSTIQRSDAVTCPSAYSRGLLGELMPDLGDKSVEVIPWGVDAEVFRPAENRHKLRTAFGWQPDDFVVLTVRRLVPRMGLERLVRAVGLAAARQRSLRLVIVGTGPLVGPLTELARQAHARIEFSGFISPVGLARHYQGADLFVLPSTTLEAFGLVILESLACGTPVLATSRCAPPEILAPLDERLLIASNEPEEMARAIVGHGAAVAAEPGFRERCRTYAVENYPWERTAEAFERVIRAALARKAREGAS